VERIDYRKGPYFATVGDFAPPARPTSSTVNSVAAPFAS
jgi:hypothetical protein